MAPHIDAKNYKEYELFYVGEEKGKVKLKLSDIVFVKTHEFDSRNKQIVLGNLKRYTLMNCKLEKLLVLWPSLVRVNKSEIISMDFIHKIEYDLITLDFVTENGKAIQVTLSRAYRKDFLIKWEGYSFGRSRP